MSIFTDSEERYDISSLGFDRSLIRTLPVLGSGFSIGEPTPELVSVFEQGVSPKNLISGELLSKVEQALGSIFNGKTAFDNTQTGYRLGVDTDDVVKFYIGNTTSYLNWTGTSLVISGSITATTGTIPK